MANKTLADRIINLREEQGLTQTELARRLHVDKSSMSKMENGIRKVSAEELKELGEIFDVSTDYLLGNTTSKHGSAPEWATDQDKKDLRKFLKDNANSMTYGGEELTNEEKQQLRVAMETIFWKRHKHD